MNKKTKQILNLVHRYVKQMEDLETETSIATLNYARIKEENNALREITEMTNKQNEELLNRIIQLNDIISTQKEQIKNLLFIKVKEYEQTK